MNNIKPTDIDNILNDFDNKKTFSPRISDNKIIFCEEDYKKLHYVRSINIQNIIPKDEGKEVWLKSYDSIIKCKITNISIRSGDKNASLKDEWKDTVSFNLTSINLTANDKKFKRHIDTLQHDYLEIFEPSVISKFVNKLIEKHNSETKYNLIDEQTTIDIVEKIKNAGIKSINKIFTYENEEYSLVSYIRTYDKAIEFEILTTPKGKGNIASGNRYSLYYLPIENNMFIRHYGAFDVPQEEEWFLDDSKNYIVSYQEMINEIKKMYKIALNINSDLYTEYFN